MFLEKDSIVAPLHLLRKGALFLYPQLSKDTIFEIVDKEGGDVIVRNQSTFEKMALPTQTMVYTERDGLLTHFYVTFDRLNVYEPFSYNNRPYVKINRQEAVNLVPIADCKKDLLTLIKTKTVKGRVLTAKEAHNLTVTPLSAILTEENSNDGLEDLVLFYPVEKFPNKAVVNTNWILTNA